MLPIIYEFLSIIISIAWLSKLYLYIYIYIYNIQITLISKYIFKTLNIVILNYNKYIIVY